LNSGKPGKNGKERGEVNHEIHERVGMGKSVYVIASKSFGFMALRKLHWKWKNS
jgi:hypothetical protein